MQITQEIKKERMAYFVASCRQKGLPLTPQKMIVYETLAGLDSHPTAQDLYTLIQNTHPNMSFATVYKNLKKFKDMKVIREIATEGDAGRFDANLEPHHHLVHVETGEIEDITMDEKVPMPDFLKKYDVEFASISYYVRKK